MPNRRSPFAHYIGLSWARQWTGGFTDDRHRNHPRPALTEDICNAIIERADERHTHPDHDKRGKRSADYILGSSVSGRTYCGWRKRLRAP